MGFFNWLTRKCNRRIWIDNHRRIRVREENIRDYIRERTIIELLERQREYREEELAEYLDKKNKENTILKQEKFIKSDKNEMCSICVNEKRAEVRTFVCEHSFCQPCLVEWYRSCLRKGFEPTCPLCRKVDHIWGK